MMDNGDLLLLVVVTILTNMQLPIAKSRTTVMLASRVGCVSWFVWKCAHFQTCTELDRCVSLYRVLPFGMECCLPFDTYKYIHQLYTYASSNRTVSMRMRNHNPKVNNRF
jgi:hypothetical protein